MSDEQIITRWFKVGQLLIELDTCNFEFNFTYFFAVSLFYITLIFMHGLTSGHKDCKFDFMPYQTVY